MNKTIFLRRPASAFFLVSLLLSLSIAPLFAQEEHSSHRASGPVPREILDRPVPLRVGIGIVHQKVNTSSPEAQSFYDQGLAYLHSYVWIEAIRSFHQALRADSNLAMAYLGLADAYVGLHDPATARAAFDRAKSLEKKLNESERAWLAIRDAEIAYAEDGSNPDAYVSYRKAVGDALKKDPNDPWLWIQRGLADEASPFTHGQAGGVDTLSFYKTAMELAPDNLPALHYYAHSNESIGRIKEALDLTATYARLAPAIPHAHHMHGHELLRIGRTEEAIQEFLKTKELEENYYRTEKIPPQYDWHHAHNLQLLALSYQILGQVKSAEALLRRSFSLPAYTEFLDYNRRAWPEFLLNRSRFEEALEASRKLTESPSAMTRLAGHSLAGEALLGLARLEDARDELHAAERETEQLPPRVVAALPYPAVLRAGILLREKNVEQGDAALLEVVKSVRSMPGPDAWCTAIFQFETIAREAREAGDWEFAGFTAKTLMEHNPNYAGGYYAMALVARNANDTAAEARFLSSAKKFWAKADADLPELVSLQKLNPRQP